LKHIGTVIVDDEPLARKTLRLLLAQHDDVDIVAECRNGIEAVKQIASKKPDLVFLDVQMPQMSGFDVVRTVGVESMPLTVFVTAYDQYALSAFDAQALDYLLKPFDDSRFERTLKRAKQLLAHSRDGERIERLSAVVRRLPKTPAHPHRSRLIVSANGKLVFLDAGGVDWITAADYYVQIHAQNKTYLHRTTMEEIECELDPDKFVRIHRSAIVNIDRVKELRPTRSGDHVVVLHDGTELKMSRRRRDQLKRLL